MRGRVMKPPTCSRVKHMVMDLTSVPWADVDFRREPKADAQLRPAWVCMGLWSSVRGDHDQLAWGP